MHQLDKVQTRLLSRVKDLYLPDQMDMTGDANLNNNTANNNMGGLDFTGAQPSSSNQ